MLLPPLKLILETNYGLTSDKKIESVIKYVADINKYNPVRDYLESLTWDGVERVNHALYHFLGVEKNVYTTECLRVFMLGAIKRVYSPGAKFDTSSCLISGTCFFINLREEFMGLFVSSEGEGHFIQGIHN